jgi:hypothetical protein
MLLGILLCFAMALCGINHVGPMNGAAHHAHPAPPACASILCVTLTSQGAPLSGKTAVVLLLPIVLAISGIRAHLLEGGPRGRGPFIKPDRLPGASNKLYRLHAVFLL